MAAQLNAAAGRSPVAAVEEAAEAESEENAVEEEQAPAYQWEVTTNYQDAEEGDSVWTLKARDQEGLDRAKAAVEEAIKAAERMSHVGFLTLPDRSVFPRIVGSKGSTVARLRNETGADITVGRENNTIVIIGKCIAVRVAAIDNHALPRL